MQAEELPPYLISMITPIYRVTNDQQIKDDKEFGTYFFFVHYKYIDIKLIQALIYLLL